MISIIIPTFNNLDYLKIVIKSINDNSFFKNEILIHINEGSDGTLEYIKQTGIKYSHSEKNEGLCVGCNRIAKKSRYDLILYSHDDMYFLPNWDKVLYDKVKSIKTEKFYLSSLMINGDPKLNGHLNLNAGDTFHNFNESFLLENYKKLNHPDFEGSTWAPHLIHKKMWDEVGGFSEEFSPGAGSDPDLNLKLWKAGVRIFKCLSESRVYHFGSITIRKKKDNLFKKNQGSRANKIFLLKWGFSIKFFKRYYLRSHYIHNNDLDDPAKNFSFFKDLLLNKIAFLYYKFFSPIKF